MYKVIRIGNKNVPMISNGGTLREYRHFFKRDLLCDFMKVKAAYDSKNFEGTNISEMLENIAWTMAHKANPNIKDIDEWLDQFDDAFSIIKAFEQIKELFDSSMQTTVKPKKKTKQTMKK